MYIKTYSLHISVSLLLLKRTFLSPKRPQSYLPWYKWLFQIPCYWQFGQKVLGSLIMKSNSSEIKSTKLGKITFRVPCVFPMITTSLLDGWYKKWSVASIWMQPLCEFSRGWQWHSSPPDTRRAPRSYLGSIHTDNPIAVSGAVIEVGNSDSLLACRNPVLLRAGVNLEDMGSGGEDGLFSGIGRDRRNGCMSLRKVKCPSSPAWSRHVESTRQRAPGNPPKEKTEQWHCPALSTFPWHH